MIRLISTLILSLLVSCTQNISCVHTQGEAQDVIDTEQAPVNDVKPALDLSLPLAP